jgi:hypothetical protein
MSSAGFVSSFPGIERPQAYALDFTANGIGEQVLSALQELKLTVSLNYLQKTATAYRSEEWTYCIAQ